MPLMVPLLYLFDQIVFLISKFDASLYWCPNVVFQATVCLVTHSCKGTIT